MMPGQTTIGKHRNLPSKQDSQMAGQIRARSRTVIATALAILLPLCGASPAVAAGQTDHTAELVPGFRLEAFARPAIYPTLSITTTTSAGSTVHCLETPHQANRCIATGKIDGTGPIAQPAAPPQATWVLTSSKAGPPMLMIVTPAPSNHRSTPTLTVSDTASPQTATAGTSRHGATLLGCAESCIFSIPSSSPIFADIIGRARTEMNLHRDGENDLRYDIGSQTMNPAMQTWHNEQSSPTR